MGILRTAILLALVSLCAFGVTGEGILTREAWGQSNKANQFRNLFRRSRALAGHREVVGPHETLVGVRLPPPWDVKDPKPGDRDFGQAHDAAWGVLGAALEGLVVRKNRIELGPCTEKCVDEFASSANIFRLWGFEPAVMLQLRERPGIVFVSNDPGAVYVKAPQPGSTAGSPESEIMHPAQIGLENPGDVTYVDIDGAQHTSLNDVDVDILGAWEVTVGSPEVVVATIDTGFDLSTPEITSNVYTNSKEIPCNGIDDDRNGFMDDYQGYDTTRKTGCFSSSPTSTRLLGKGTNEVHPLHGTSTTLTMASLPRTITKSITGVAPGIRYLPISVGQFSQWELDSAYAYILALRRAGVPIRVVNLSLSTDYLQRAGLKSCGDRGFNPGWTSSLTQLLNSDITVVAAAGNEGLNNDISTVCPANIARGASNVIAVAAVDPAGQHPFYSNFGKINVTISAPGTAIYTGYGYQTGTSASAAIVSGIVALMYSANCRLTAAEVKRVIIDSAKMTELNLPTLSRGVISATKAVKAARQLSPNGACTIKPPSGQKGGPALKKPPI